MNNNRPMTEISVWRVFDVPANTLRNNDVVITAKQRHFDVITPK